MNPLQNRNVKPDSPPPSDEQAISLPYSDEWNELSEEQQELYEKASIKAKIAPNYKKLMAAKRNVYRTHGLENENKNLSAYDFWLLSYLAKTDYDFQCNLAAELLKSIQPPKNLLDESFVRAAARNDYSIMLALAKIAAFVVLPVTAAYYASKKTRKSIINFFQGEKQAKSLVRLAATFVGSIFGIKCASIVIGAAIGSSVPVVGTIIGAVVGFCIGAGAGAIISKYAMRLVYAIKNRNNNDAISKTNPEKYALTGERKDYLEKQEMGDTNSMLAALRKQKNNSKPEIKDAYNELLNLLKNKDEEVDLKAGIQIKNWNFFWSKDQGEEKGKWKITPTLSQPQQVKL